MATADSIDTLDLITRLAELAEGNTLSRVIVSATLDAQGVLGRVGGVSAKLEAFFGRSAFQVLNETGQFPPHIVAVSDQQGELLVPGMDEYRKGHSLPRLLAPRIFSELVLAIATQQSHRKDFKPKTFDVLQKDYPASEFKGRLWLFDRIEKIIAEREHGIITLAAGPGFGKTAFLLKLIAEHKERKFGGAWLAAWHILRKDQPNWLPTAVLAGQIEWQLRDQLLLPLSQTESGQPVDQKNAPAVLKVVLEEAAGKLAEGEKLLIVIDGLDEAFGDNAPISVLDQAPLLRELFPRQLPKGVFILITSRPGFREDDLGAPGEIARIDMDGSELALQAGNRKDLREYLKERIDAADNRRGTDNKQMAELVERMVEACEGGFYVAEWFARTAASDEKDKHGHTQFDRWLQGETLPRGIDETLKKDWANKRNRLEAQGHHKLLPVLATAIALWHDAGTCASRSLIRDLIEGAATAAYQGDRSVPRSVGHIDTEDITRNGIEACLAQLADWLFPAAPTEEPLYRFRHSRIPQLLLESLIPEGGAHLIHEVHTLLAWSCARWPRLKGETRNVALRHLPLHLIEVGKEDPLATKQLADTLLDYGYLVAVLGADPNTETRPLAIHDLTVIVKTAMPVTVAIDSQTEEAVRLLAGTLDLSAPALSDNPPELPSQLHGRLNGFANPLIRKLLNQAERDTTWAWLQPESTFLSAPGGPLLRVLEGHKSVVTHVALSADGKRAVSASHDGTLRVWNVESGQALRVLEGHTDRVGRVALSADGKRAVSASWDKTLRVWDVDSGKSLSVFKGHTDRVNHVALNADCKRAVSASKDNTLRVWNVETSQTLKVLEGHTDRVIHVALSADGKRAVSASWDKTLRIWDVETGQTLQVLEGHTDLVIHVALSMDGKRAVSASWDKTLRVWDVETGQALHVLEGHTFYVNHVALSADGKCAVSASIDHTLRVWDVGSGKALQVLEGHTGAVNHVVFSADGKRAVSASDDRTLRIWEVEAGKTLQVLEGHTFYVNHVALSADSRHAVSASDGHTLRVWDLESGKALQMFEGHTEIVNEVALSADGKRAVSASGERYLRVWDVETGQPLQVLEGHTDSIKHFALSADGKRAVSMSDDGTQRVWNLETGQALQVLEGTGWGQAKRFVFSADGKRAVSSSTYDKMLRVWEVETGKKLLVFEGHTDSINHFALSADGKRAVSASRDNTLRVWEVETGQTLQVLDGHTNWVCHVALSADGERAVSASDDHTLRVWNVATGQALHVLEGHTHWVNHVALSADGKRAISASRDNTLRVWEVETGQTLQVLDGHTLLSADGKRAVSASDDRTLRVWDFGTGTTCARLKCNVIPVAMVLISNGSETQLVGGHNNGICVIRLHEPSR